MNESYKDICKSLKVGGWCANFETQIITFDKLLLSFLSFSSRRMTFEEFFSYILSNERETIIKALESFSTTQIFNCLINLQIDKQFYLVEAVLNNPRYVEGKLKEVCGYIKLNSVHNSPSANIDQLSLEELIPGLVQQKNLETFYQEQSKRVGLACKVGLIYPWTWYVNDNSLEFMIFDGAKINRKVVSISNFSSTIDPNDKNLFYLEIGKIALNKSRNLHLKYRSNCFNEECMWYEMIGEAFEFDSYGKCTKAVGVLYDITDREQKARILAEKEKQLIIAKEKAEKAVADRKIVLDNLNVGLVYMNKDFVVQWESLSLFSQLLGPDAYKPGHFCYKSVYGREAPCDNCPIKRMFLSKRLEYHTLERNGEILEVTANPVINDHNQIVGGVLKLENITLRIKQEKELIVAKEKAEESNRLKSAFLANMSHEIRTPLNAIVGFSDLLLEAVSPEEKTEYINIIKKNNDLLLQLISDILDLSKIEAQALEFVRGVTDVNSLCRGVVAAGNLKIGAKVPVIFESHIPECYIETDKNRINQVLSNMITNALKFTEKGDVRIGYHITNDTTIRFYVKDTGIGIEKERLESIFERFVKLNHFAQGTGLGLAICKNIVEQLGGRIGVDSEWGEGTCFWFTLPYDKNLKKPAEANATSFDSKLPDFLLSGRSKKINSTPSRKIRILIAEDIDSNYLLIRDTFKDNYELIRAENGKEAIEKYKDISPDLILMDIKMPEMDGLEATRQIRQIDPFIPIVAVTAYAYDSDIEQAEQAGCNAFLTKPISVAELQSKIKEYVE